MKRFILITLLALASCVPFTGMQPGQSTGPLPTPHFEEADYPTIAVTPFAEKSAQAVGVELQVMEVHREGKQVEAKICYTLPDDSGWAIWQAALFYTDQQVTEFGSSLYEILPPIAEGQPGLRCDLINFFVPPDANLANTTLVIESIGAFPRPGEYCSKYFDKIQTALAERGTGIVIQCVEKDGINNLEIVSYPEGMNRVDAEEIVYGDEFFTVTGPWTFTFDLNKQP